MGTHAWTLLLTALLPVSACGTEAVPTSATNGGGVERAAVRPDDGSREQALASGVLRADPTTGCLWLELPDGAPATQLLLYGDNYRVDFNAAPASVMDGNDVVARVGQPVEVGGGFGTGAGVAGCPVTGTLFHGYFED